MAHSIPKRHPELVSGSVRGEEQERLAESMTIQGAKSQKPTAKVKNMFFCSSVEKRKRKPKASDEKRSGIIRETLSLKLQGCRARQNAPCPKNKTKRVLWLIDTKMSGQPSANSQNQPLKNTPFCPFSIGAQNYTNRIALIICTL